MHYRTFEPPTHLAPYIRFYWVLEGEVGRGGEFVHRSMADGCVEMVFHYRAGFDDIVRDGTTEVSPLSSVQAQSSRFRRFVTRNSFGIFGAYLFPYAIPRLFGYSAADLTNISPDLESLFGIEGRFLEEEMIVARCNPDRVAIVSRFLTDKLRISRRELPDAHHAVNEIIRTEGRVPVRQLALRYELSTRQFERKFKDVAGLSPKLYSRVIRFQAATQYKLTGTRDLTEIAYACGYYDQSHFINDFREFSGYTPKEYFWTTAEGTQYMGSDDKL